ncbi:hypothetical protein [Pseudoalteromonas sp. MMG005]|uniref:hypothetical protein n=1 Tax=Pseudoalteromonas sp. MMG005 TaxID=2822682 RepID=UPI001B3A74E6|nr:hypothetical protein [Pseudoalteromonas sp. MMG005]MBQ4848403.1 hypothetical protein [Pseudoalteromonas sp. MMG005]
MINVTPSTLELNKVFAGENFTHACICSHTPLKNWLLLDFDVQQFPFAEIMSKQILKCDKIDKYHENIMVQRAEFGLSQQLFSQDNLFFRDMIITQTQGSGLIELYHQFINKFLAYKVAHELSFDERPDIRVHLPGTLPVSEFHDDYSITHHFEQINMWLPLVDTAGTSTLWLESDYGTGQVTPIDVKYGQVLLFDGGILKHGSRKNETNNTRISLESKLSLLGAGLRADAVHLLDRFSFVQ